MSDLATVDAMSTTATDALSPADRAAHAAASYVRPTPGDVYVAAARADHRAHCTPCRERAAAIDAAITENGESMARRDRIQLGLRNARKSVA